VSELTFDPAGHKYYVGGVEYPSVTTILKVAGVYDEYADVDPAILARAGLRGDAVHQAIEVYLTTGHWPDHIRDDDIVGPYLDAFWSWYRWSNFEVWHVEHRTYSIRHGVAGTIDIVGKLDGVPSIIDVKSTRMLNKVATGYQTAAYRLLYNEHEDDPAYRVRNRYALHLRNDGTPRLEPLKNPLDELKFIGMAMKHGRRA